MAIKKLMMMQKHIRLFAYSLLVFIVVGTTFKSSKMVDASPVVPKRRWIVVDEEEKHVRNNQQGGSLREDPDCVNEVDFLGRCTVSYCIHGKTETHLNCLEVLMQNGVDLQHEANDGLRPIHIAVVCNNLKGTETLLKKKVSLNVEDSEGRYPLHLAAGYSEKAIVKKLLDAGADKTSLDNDEMTAVMWACHFDLYENMELLLNISHDDEMRFEIIDAELKDKDKMGRNLLHWSISNTVNKQCFKVLMRSDYVNVVDNNGKNILHHIAENGALGAFEEFLEISGDGGDDTFLNIVDHQGRTPLHWACIGGHGELVDILLNRGASIESIDVQGNTPFDYTKQKGLNYCLLVILSHLKYRYNNSSNKIPQNQKPPDTRQQNSSNKSPQTMVTVKATNKPGSNKLNENIKARDTSSTVREPKSISDAKNTPERRLSNNGRDTPSNIVIADEKRKPLKRQDDVKISSSSPNVLRISHDVRNVNDDNFGGGDQDDDDFSQRQRGNSYSTTFDTPQGDLEQHHRQRRELSGIKVGSDNENDHSDEDSDPKNIFNDQLVVLVQHRGSDDELVIGLDDGYDITNSDLTNGDEVEDLLDIPFARNGSITTVGVVSEGNMAFNSVSAMDPSVSSLVSSSLGDDVAVDVVYGDENRKIISANSNSSKRGSQPKPLSTTSSTRSHPKPSSLSPKKAEYSPRLPASAPPLDPTAPIPPPPLSSHAYNDDNHGGGYYYQDMNADVMVFDEDGYGGGGGGDDKKNVSGGRHISSDLTIGRPKTSKGRRNQTDTSRSIRDSFPPPSTVQGRVTRKESNNAEVPPQQKTPSPRTSSTVRLAPLSAASLPKPPSYRYDA